MEVPCARGSDVPRLITVMVQTITVGGWTTVLETAQDGRAHGRGQGDGPRQRQDTISWSVPSA